MNQASLLLSICLLIMIPKDIISQSASTFIAKRGGICFRTDDDQPIAKYLEYAALFNNYNKKFTFAINLGMNEITTDYVNGLRQIQAAGHEMMDHTPWHRTNYFLTKLNTDYYLNHPGVHRISGNKIELNHANVDIAYAKRTGYVNISGDTITSSSGVFSQFSLSDCYLYFPTIGWLVFIDESFGWINANKVKVTDVWRNSINLGQYQNIKFYNFDFNNVHLTKDGFKALAEESIRLTNYYNLQRPFSWVQPGGYFPHVYKNEVKQAIGDALGFKAAGVFTDPSLKVFNEYNPDNNKQFGMDYGDFRDDNWTLTQCKNFIADRIAKHRVVFGETHFTSSIGGLLGGWTGFLDRTEKLIQWCITNNIPIRTYSEWADILYKQVPDPNENIFPPLNVDLDSNNVSDGYDSNMEGTLKKNDGYPTINDYCFSISKVGQVCSITDLGGIEKGYNDFEIWTKGSPGNFIEVTFKVGLQNFVYKFPVQSTTWTKYNLTLSVNGNTTLNIPEDVSLINATIKCSNYSSGEIKISGMKFSKPSIIFSAKLFLEGPYNSATDSMITSIQNFIPTTSPYTQDPRTVSSIPANIVDWVLVELRSNTSAPPIISKSLFLHKSGNIVADDGINQNILLNVKPDSYYIVIKHRNSIETWSASPCPLGSQTTLYNFTTDSSRAYGNNMKKKGTKWCIYSGDVNQDGFIDGADVTNSFIASGLGLWGYLVQDLTRDGYVDGADVSIVLNNELLGIVVQYPSNKNFSLP